MKIDFSSRKYTQPKKENFVPLKTYLWNRYINTSSHHSSLLV
jgi:hypothetical protein